MKKLNYEDKLGITVYNEKLKNGLDIYLAPMLNKTKYFMTYGTYYGSTSTHFMLDDKEIKVPNGTAHFIEHKMFEEEDKVDPFSFYSKSGTDCNASTNYTSTKYIVEGTKCFKENLEYLIKYVNSPYFTNSNVEKEKGIIKEEIKMYKDDPESSIDDLIRMNLYHKDNHKYDVAGEVEDINKITKEDLYNCYNAFYNPNNMFLVIVGNFDIEEAKAVIETLNTLENKARNVKVINKKEEESVVKEYEEKKENILVPKVLMGIKTDIKKFKKIDKYKLNLYLNIIIHINFGPSSLLYEKLTEDNILSDSYSFLETLDDIKTIYLYGESINPDKLIEEYKNKIKDLSVTQEELERAIKIMKASEIRMCDYVDGVTSSIVGDLTRYKKVITKPLELFDSLTLDEMKYVIESINKENISVVKYMPQNISF